MRAEDKAYAVAFAVPVNTPGVKLIASPHGGHKNNEFEHPITARHKMMETLTVFDNVFVPKERVFLQGEIDFAGLLALTFVRFHRFTAVSYKLPLLEMLAGAGFAAAEATEFARGARARQAHPSGGVSHHGARSDRARRRDLHHRRRRRGAEHTDH